METIITGLTCMWDIGTINSMINMEHTKPYKRNILYNNV